MIRPYRPADLEPLLDVWFRASSLAHPFLDPAFQAQERRNIPELYLPNTETWVREVDGKVAGFVSMMGNEVGALFVDPERHRSGIGRELIDHVRARHDALEVEVFVRNAIGRAFYEKVGFVRLLTKTHEATGFELLRMRLGR